MIDAGVAVYVRVDPDDDPATTVVAEIYREMLKARGLSSPKTPLVERT
jgi:hypothetical protein